MDILKDLFDEKLIEIIDLFIENPEKQFSLTDISESTKINVATTFRILKKLSTKEFITPIPVGKVKEYKLAKNEKTNSLVKILKKDTGPLQVFTGELSKFPEIKKIILESNEGNVAKLMIIGDSIKSDEIKKISEDIEKESKLKITFVEISEKQYESLKEFKNYGLDKKIIWER